MTEDLSKKSPKELRDGIIALFQQQEKLMQSQMENFIKALVGFNQQITQLEQENSELRARLHKRDQTT